VLDELQRRNYSPATTRGYILAIKQFAEYFGKSPERLGGDEIRQFELYLLKEKKLAPGTVEGRMSALRFLYRKVLKRRDIAYDDLIFPKVPRKLPVVLSPEEITKMIEAAPNRMHRTILMLLYAAGIRRTETSLLKVSDIDSERMVIHVHQGKGSRDRDVPMTPRLLDALREYFRWKRPKVYLFPSTEGHRGVDARIEGRWIVFIRFRVRFGHRNQPCFAQRAAKPVNHPRLQHRAGHLERNFGSSFPKRREEHDPQQSRGKFGEVEAQRVQPGKLLDVEERAVRDNDAPFAARDRYFYRPGEPMSKRHLLYTVSEVHTRIRA
jgi:integrase